MVRKMWKTLPLEKFPKSLMRYCTLKNLYNRNNSSVPQTYLPKMNVLIMGPNNFFNVLGSINSRNRKHNYKPLNTVLER